MRITQSRLSKLSTFRELDQALGVAKGLSFRTFKQLEPNLNEGRDFHLLRADEDVEILADLRDQERIYPASINVVLLEPAAVQRIKAIIRPERL